MASATDEFDRFLVAHGVDHDDWESRRLGTDPDMVERILAVIEQGEKTMTFSLPWLADMDGRREPAPGRCIVLLDTNDAPRLLVRLTAVKDRAFGAVSAEDVAREGIPMRDPEAWRDLHRLVWNARLAPLGRKVTDDMPVWAEYFERLLPQR